VVLGRVFVDRYFNPFLGFFGLCVVPIALLLDLWYVLRSFWCFSQSGRSSKKMCS